MTDYMQNARELTEAEPLQNSDWSLERVYRRVLARTLEALDTERAAHEATKAELQALREWPFVAIKLHLALSLQPQLGCPRCSGDCGSANPPILSCPMQAATEAYKAFDALIRKDA